MHSGHDIGHQESYLRATGQKQRFNDLYLPTEMFKLIFRREAIRNNNFTVISSCVGLSRSNALS